MTPRRYTLLLAAIGTMLILAMVAAVLAGGRHQVRVIDGDTFEVTVRLAKIDAPELKGKCKAERQLAIRAATRLRQLIADARKLELVPSGRWDRYGRLLASLTADGRDVEDVLIREGLARPWEGRRRSWCK